jgi:hypothetical protein
MRIKVQITVESGGGESETVELARLERASLRPDTLGLSLAEARAILAGLEQTLVEILDELAYALEIENGNGDWRSTLSRCYPAMKAAPESRAAYPPFCPGLGAGRSVSP